MLSLLLSLTPLSLRAAAAICCCAPPLELFRNEKVGIMQETSQTTRKRTVEDSRCYAIGHGDRRKHKEIRGKEGGRRKQESKQQTANKATGCFRDAASWSLWMGLDGLDCTSRKGREEQSSRRAAVSSPYGTGHRQVICKVIGFGSGFGEATALTLILLGFSVCSRSRYCKTGEAADCPVEGGWECVV